MYLYITFNRGFIKAMRKKIVELKTKQELDAWTTFSYLTEPSHEIKYLKISFYI